MLAATAHARGTLVESMSSIVIIIIILALCLYRDTAVFLVLSGMAPHRLIFINCKGFRMSLPMPNWSVLVMLARPMFSAVYIGSLSINA